MAEYWLISAPGEKTCQKTWDRLNSVTTKQNDLSINYKLSIPDLKVGTLDQLVGLSDDLAKLDLFVESVARKIANYLGDVLEEQRDKIAENLTANNMDLHSYITRFQWDMAKYPIKQSLRNITDMIGKQVSQIDGDLKTKSMSYNQLKAQIQQIERKSTGSLMTRNVADLVTKKDFVLNSEYLTTLLVVIPRNLYADWESKYESLVEMVVPRSSRFIHEDNEYGLYAVTLFRKNVDDFKYHARQNRFTVKDFVYDESILAAGKTEITKLEADKKKQFGPLVRWLKVNFSEAFTAWIHVKALRVFTESVLRYGLPVNFQAMVLIPHKKQIRRLRDVLGQLYSHLDTIGGPPGGGQGADIVDIPGLNLSHTDYYPYVFYKVTLDLVDLGRRM